METIRRSDKIYAWANEYHVMGLGTFKRGWCLMELGVTKAPPIIYTKEPPRSKRRGIECDDIEDIDNAVTHEHKKSERRAALHELLRYEKAGFSEEDDRAIVRGFIESARGDVARFEAFLVLKAEGPLIREAKRRRRGWEREIGRVCISNGLYIQGMCKILANIC